jgi:hypothetical protein
MKPFSSFASRFATLISWILSCFDRVIFKGYLPISRPDQFSHFVDRVLKLRRVEFIKKVAPHWAQRIVDHSKSLAQRQGRTWEYKTGRVDKDAWAKAVLQKNEVIEGLLGVLCVMESCKTYKLGHSEGRPQFVSSMVPQRVLYFYFVDKKLGLMHVRLQTWAPFTCQIYVNGHDYVARQLKKKGIRFQQNDNAFVELSDPATAQRIANRFSRLRWPKILERYARRVNPLLGQELRGTSHYWVADQAEYATDICFRDRGQLALVFRWLLEFALLTFSPQKIFSYLGRKWHERFDGEVQTHYRSVREPGVCIKHFMKGNWLKMYDKLAQLIRVETVINQPGEFKILRECRHRNGETSMGWFPMGKGVGNLHHYQSHALACNERYLNALAAVKDPTPGYADLKRLTESQNDKGRNSTGFNPARQEEACLFAAVLAGDHIAHGFRNKDVRAALGFTAGTVVERRRQSAVVGRMLRRLHVRRLIAKVPRTRRWRVTDEGRRILGHLLRTYRYYNRSVA